MAHLCTKCNTLYHTEEEWTRHTSGPCVPHNIVSSPSLQDFYNMAWREVEEISALLDKKDLSPEMKAMADKLRELISEFVSAQSHPEMRRIRREIIRYLHELRNEIR